MNPITTDPAQIAMTTEGKNSAAAATMTTEVTNLLRRVRVVDIKPGINPRITFDEAELRALGSTFDPEGNPVQPPVVYVDETDGKWALIAGERRWRAAVLLGLEEMQVIVRVRPKEKDQRKMALVENVQRAALTPVEEARAVMEMLAMTTELGVPVYNRAQLAAELGRDPAHITRCETLMRCSERLLAAVHRGEVEFRLGAMIGSLPKALHEMAEAELVFRTGGPLAREVAAQRIADYRRDLNKAQFDPADGTLVPGAGACAMCEFNGANRSDVEGKTRARVCLNPVCFDAKQAAFVALSRKHADDGQAVMVAADEVSRVFSFDGVTVRGDSGYVAADATPDEVMLVNPKAKLPVWEKLLTGCGLKVTLATDGEGRLRRLYDAQAALLAVCAPECEWARYFKGHDQTREGVKDSTGGSGGGGVLGGEPPVDVEMVEAKKAAHAAAVENGRVLAGQDWMVKVDAANGTALRQMVVRRVIERLTAPEDRAWMACVMTGDLKRRGDVWEVLLGGEADHMEDEDVMPVLSLALIARTMRLQGPALLPGLVDELCPLIGYDAAGSARLIENEAKAAADALGGKPRKGRKGAVKEMPEMVNKLEPETEPEPLDQVWPVVCTDAEPEPEAETEAVEVPSAAAGGGGRVNAPVDPAVRENALRVYLETGSINTAATRSGATVAAVRNWHLRGQWKALREVRLAKAAEA